MVTSALASILLDSPAAPPQRLTPLGADQRAGGTIRVAIAHGRRLVRAGLHELLEREAGIAVVGEAADGDEAVALTRRLRPNVVLVDVDLPGLDCVAATRRMLARQPVAVMVLTASETDARLIATLRAGATGLLAADREPAELARAVRLLGRGGRLSARRSHRNHPITEVHVLTPKVIEIRRGCAHGAPTGPVRPLPHHPPQGGPPSNSGI
jgi:DNA-binding NarL/FixJ family response regulator